MTGKFSKYLKSKKPIIKKLVEILGTKYSYVSVLATDVSGVSINVDKSSTNVAPSGITESGFVIKVYNDSVYSEYSLNEIEEKNFDEIISEIERLANANSTIENVNVNVLQEETLEKKFNRKNVGKVYTTEEIISILSGYVKETLESSPLIVNATAAIENTEISKMF
ncbi:MAG: TldD/PmbA family protein, partial [Bacilli bacterium]